MLRKPMGLDINKRKGVMGQNLHLRILSIYLLFHIVSVQSIILLVNVAFLGKIYTIKFYIFEKKKPNFENTKKELFFQIKL